MSIKQWIVLTPLCIAAAACQATSTQNSNSAAVFNEQDYSQLLPVLQQEASEGSADAQYKLGLMYNQDQGTKQDDAKAIEWFKKSAAQNDARAIRAGA
ncbi:SEL1-like repeat protein [Psychrobacter sp. FDAARGOS_221]|uniref:SEL1-like repeat protein n=1 Tax=Psychrobacter sp. FDAARGOS_221 TaxID=1975705 RepID=UPI000BB545A0|nr:SEL1-like repeat protein [Psychrobacter sp. FDAARGOS_221]PNK60813.1 hypothetical protein A6J60_007935 [Psychrobacter sp. FDAARGOS_221]